MTMILVLLLIVWASCAFALCCSMCICAWRDHRRVYADNESAGTSDESVPPIPRGEYPSVKPNNPIWQYP